MNACGRVASVDLRCVHCGEPMHADDVDLEPGPGMRAEVAGDHQASSV